MSFNRKTKSTTQEPVKLSEEELKRIVTCHAVMSNQSKIDVNACDEDIKAASKCLITFPAFFCPAQQRAEKCLQEKLDQVEEVLSCHEDMQNFSSRLT